MGIQLLSEISFTSSIINDPDLFVEDTRLFDIDRIILTFLLCPTLVGACGMPDVLADIQSMK